MGYIALFEEKNPHSSIHNSNWGWGRVYLNNVIKIMFLEQHPSNHPCLLTRLGSWTWLGSGGWGLGTDIICQEGGPGKGRVWSQRKTTKYC